MIEYLKELAATIQVAQQNQLGSDQQKIHGYDVPDIHSLFAAFAEELNRLDPRDFAPAVRHDFVMLRVAIRNNARGQIGDGRKAAATAATMSSILDAYAGEGSGAVTRQFPFVTNPDVRRIIERDYCELTQKAFPDGSWKSTVILAGSILEAVLYDRLTRDPPTIAAAMGSAAAGRLCRRRSGGIKDITLDDFENQWSLNAMIAAACELHLLPYANEDAIHQVLREYRNYVHPRLEVRTGVFISEGHATASKGMLDVILDEIK